MPEVVYPRSREFPGPFLIDWRHLEKLDAIISEQCSLLDAESESEVAPEIEVAVRRSGAELDDERRRVIEQRIRSRQRTARSREVAVTLKKRKTIKAASFSEIAAELSQATDQPIGFYVSISSLRTSASISSQRPAWKTGIEVTVEPSGPRTQRLRFALENWVQEVSSPYWQRAWRSIKSWGFPLMVISLAAIALILFGAFEQKGAATTAYRRQLQAQARELLEAGISPENLGQAIWFDLALASEYVPDSSRVTSGRLPVVPLALGCALAVSSLMLPFCPTLELGLGLGTARIGRWRVWFRLVGVTIPSLIGLGVVVPLLVHGLLGV
ncbi:MAG: hypothetical protein NT125_08610 [Candidatus Bipolaricaulota bacterium]|nr:hypothetical protein [Candidatus Bipolaricaulota bacterium]